MNCARCGHGKHSHAHIDWPTRREPCELCLHCHQVRPLGKDCCTSPRWCDCRQYTAPEPTDRWSQDIEAGAIGEIR